MSDADIDQAVARRFVGEIIRVTGWSASALAKRAGVAHTTLTRFMKGDVAHTLSARTISKIRRAAMTEIPVDQLDALWLLSQREPSARPRAGMGV